MLFHLLGVMSLVSGVAVASKPSKPNIILILTNDQDVHMQSMDYMPLLKTYMVDKGTLYKRHYWYVENYFHNLPDAATESSQYNCSMLSSLSQHHDWKVGAQLQCHRHDPTLCQGLNDDYLPVWLQDNGYNTYYTGKLFNAHTTENYDKPHAAGWTSSDFLLDPFTHSYWNATWQKDFEKPVSRGGYYNTDDLADKTINYIREAHATGKPFFLGSAPIAPHDEACINPEALKGAISPDSPEARPQILPPFPALRHENMFAGLKVPRTPNFNPDKPSGVNWVARLPRLNQTSIDYNDNYFRRRLQALQAVDEMVERIVQELEKLNIADNTYVIYTTDNGYHLSQYRLQPGKTCGFETDIHIPLLIRGPGIPKGAIVDVVTNHTNLVPTIFRMAGIPAKPEFDGVAVPLTNNEIFKGLSARAEHIAVEYWGLSIDESWNSSISLGNTYKGIRLQSKDYSFYYAVHCTNEHELYDISADPYQIKNLLPSGPNGTGIAITDYNSTTKVYNRPPVNFISRLDSMMMVMKSCKGKTCQNPWSTLRPESDVRSLEDALDKKYDDFYLQSARSNSVRFSMCANGYIVAVEGPQNPLVYQTADWSAMT